MRTVMTSLYGCDKVSNRHVSYFDFSVVEVIDFIARKNVRHIGETHTFRYGISGFIVCELDYGYSRVGYVELCPEDVRRNSEQMR